MNAHKNKKKLSNVIDSMSPDSKEVELGSSNQEASPSDLSPSL